MNLKLILIELRWFFLIKGYFKTLMGHDTSLCQINAGAGVNEHASALMKIKRLSLITCEVGTRCGIFLFFFVCGQHVTSLRNWDHKWINLTLSFMHCVWSTCHLSFDSLHYDWLKAWSYKQGRFHCALWEMVINPPVLMSQVTGH